MSNVQLEIRYEYCQNNVYFPGQQVTGRVNLLLNEPMKMRGIRLKINGMAHTNIPKYPADVEFFNIVLTVYEKPEGVSGDDPILATGSYNFPFVFQLPLNCPSSFESQSGYIRYTTTAVIERPWHFDIKCTVPFIVVGIVDLNKEPASLAPFQLDQSMELCGLCSGGYIECHLNLPRSGFVPGETIPLNFAILNKSDTINVASVNVKLVEIVACRARIPSRTQFAEREICQFSGSEIAAGNSDDWTGKVMLIPPIAPSINNCSIIFVNYLLRIVVAPSGCHKKMTFTAPILIGNVPLVSSYHPLSVPGVIIEQPKPSAPPVDGACPSSFKHLSKK